MKINTPVTAAKSDQDQPETARDTIRAAVEEHKAAAVDEKKEIKAQEEKKEPDKVDPPKEPEKKEEKAPEKVEPASDEKKEEKASDEKKEEKEPEKKEDKPSKPAPFGLPKDIRAEWDKLSPKTQDYLAKVSKENNEHKSNQGRRAYLNDVDQVLTPYMPELQRLGASPAQLVKRLLDYSDALASEKTKYGAIAKLAQDFNIDLSAFGKAKGDPDPKAAATEQVYEDYIPPELNAKLDTIINRFAQMETTQKSDNDKAAEQALNSWGGFDPTTNEFKNKPFFPMVRHTMHSLIANGTIPFKDGKIDLDGAYEAACYVHPEIREYMVEEETRIKNEKIEKEQQEKAAAIARAKNAASSIRPGAPAPRLPVPVKNGKGQQLSVRDALKLAMAEVRESRA